MPTYTFLVGINGVDTRVDPQTMRSYLGINLANVATGGSICAQALESNGPNGGFRATHPTSPGFKLQYGSLDYTGLHLYDERRDENGEPTHLIMLKDASVRQEFDKDGNIVTSYQGTGNNISLAVPVLIDHTTILYPQAKMVAWNVAENRMTTHNGTAWV